MSDDKTVVDELNDGIEGLSAHYLHGDAWVEGRTHLALIADRIEQALAEQQAEIARLKRRR